MLAAPSWETLVLGESRLPARAALKLSASSFGSTQCSRVRTRACLLLPCRPICCGHRTGSQPMSLKAVTHSKWRCSCTLSKLVPLSKSSQNPPACTPLHGITGEKKPLLCSDKLRLLCRSFGLLVCLQLLYLDDLSSFSSSS